MTTSQRKNKRFPGGGALFVSLVAALCALAPGAFGGNGADGSTFVLSSYDGTILVAANDQSHSFVAQFGSTMTFKPAALDKYIPNDPCGQAAANYNSALIVATSDGGVALSSAISSLAGCKAKVVFDAQDPYIPNDPYVPPNPIKGFQPVA